MDKDLNNCVVTKPWGYEYLAFRNNNLAIWFLRIKENQQTSMHCHPNKKTSLILLKGAAEISFLFNKVLLKGFSRIMIWTGVFHSTKATSKGGITLLEVETPDDKDNLVRLNDSYGRQCEKYESSQHWKEKTGEELWIPSKKDTPVISHGYRFTVKELDESLIKKLKKKDIVVSLVGDCIMTKQNIPICKVGDLLTKATLQKFSNANFVIQSKTLVLHITKT